MIESADFTAALAAQDIDFFAGVPDSLLQHFLTHLLRHVAKDRHIVTANEGAAIGLACGYHLATSRIACVYMQNSGLGNAINPLMSLVDPAVYSVPVLLLIGWRGEPGVKDEPQHVKQGAVTEEMLQAMKLPYTILQRDSDFRKMISEAVSSMRETSGPFAILIRKDTFAAAPTIAMPTTKVSAEHKLIQATAVTASGEPKPAPKKELSRESVVAQIALTVTDALFIATTGKIGRELFETRKQTNSSSEKDFLCVGSMGHACQIALGTALHAKDKKIVCFDGDGSALMHLGNLAGIAKAAPKNLIHVILNNRCHESVGGQPTVNPATDFAALAKHLGYKTTIKVTDEISLQRALHDLPNAEGPVCVEVLVASGSRENLARPDQSPKETKEQFMRSFV